MSDTVEKEMLENLDLLLEMDVAEEEGSWNVIEKLDEAQESAELEEAPDETP